ncbi:MAG TPA: hypothetical protein VF136_00305 [Methylomirabilota bacterium]
MMRPLLHAAAGALLGGSAGAVAMVLAYAWSPALVLEMGHDRPGLLAGVYRGERDGGRTFAWTTSRADLRLPGLDRHVSWSIRVHARGSRQDPADLPALTILADGLPVAEAPTANEYRQVSGTAPARLDGRRGLTISLASSTTFVPGQGDPRELGLQIDRVEVRPSARTVLAPPQSVVAAAVPAAIFGAVFGWLSATALTAVVAAVLLAFGQAAVIGLGTGPYAGEWMADVVRLAAGIALGLLAVTMALPRARRTPLRNTARFVLLFSAAALYLKLLVLLHPDKWLVDALFHVHRLQDVMGGRLYFTSIAPGGYQFPYPVGLYVAALPFTWWIADRVELLRIVVAVADVASLALIYWALARTWGDRLTAAAAVGIAHLIPLGFLVQGSANLTNAFGQAVAVIAMVLVIGRPARAGWGWWAAAFVALLWAMLSHTSTFATLSAIAVLAGLLVIVLGRPADLAYGRATLALAVTAIVTAVAVYYAHFVPTYRAELTRIAAEVRGGPDVEAPDSPVLYQPGGASIPARLMAVPRAASDAYTAGFLTLAGVGLVAGVRRFGRDSRWLVVLGWLGACLLLLIVGILTPVAFRHYYAAQPAVAILAGLGLTTLWRAKGAWRLAGAALAGWGVWAGVDRWLSVLRVSIT